MYDKFQNILKSHNIVENFLKKYLRIFLFSDINLMFYGK